MVGQSSPDSLPLWFPVVFVGMWLGVGALLSLFSGWPKLAQRFRAGARPDGHAIKGQVVKIGLVPESRVTHMVASAEGLYLWVNPFFRFLQPPLMIPWAAITGVCGIDSFWRTTYELNVADITTIRITGRAHDVLRPFLLVPGLAA